MTVLREIDRTATVAWSPGQHLPILALGTVSGALDASFSIQTELELFDLNLSSQNNDTASNSCNKKASIPGTSR
jgi:protein transport protein SEC31